MMARGRVKVGGYDFGAEGVPDQVLKSADPKGARPCKPEKAHTAFSKHRMSEAIFRTRSHYEQRNEWL
jgi:hypothetical protein